MNLYQGVRMLREDSMSNELVQKLREIIDEKHRRAIAALDTIGAYLDEVPADSNGAVPSVERVTRPASEVALEVLSRPVRPVPKLERKSIRSRVLESITGRYATVEEIVGDCPGITKKQVWGVLTAPDLRDSILVGTGGPENAYRLKERIQMMPR
jgi:hypothetical protein